MNINTKELKIGDKICHPVWKQFEYLEFPGEGKGWILPDGRQAPYFGNLPPSGWTYFNQSIKLIPAIKLLIDGKKIRRRSWKPEVFIYLVDGNLLFDDGNHYVAGGDDFQAEDWVIYEEKTYSFIDIIKIVKPGVYFRRKSWVKLATATLKSDGMFQLDYLYKITKEDFLAEDWIIVKS